MKLNKALTQGPQVNEPVGFEASAKAFEVFLYFSGSSFGPLL